MKQYEIYLFDFDYTLADSSKGIVMCFRHVLDTHGHTGISDEDIKHTIGKTLVDSFSILTGIEDSDILNTYRTEYEERAALCMTKNTTLFTETMEVLTELKKRGAKIGIISTKYSYRIIEFLNLHFPTDFFDIVIGVENVTNPKPSPEGLLFAIDSLNGNLQNILYIGDSIIDAETARAAGTDFVGVLHGMTSMEELSVYPHIEIANSLNALI